MKSRMIVAALMLASVLFRPDFDMTSGLAHSFYLFQLFQLELNNRPIPRSAIKQFAPRNPLFKNSNLLFQKFNEPFLRFRSKEGPRHRQYVVLHLSE